MTNQSRPLFGDGVDGGDRGSDLDAIATALAERLQPGASFQREVLVSKPDGPHWVRVTVEPCASWGGTQPAPSGTVITESLDDAPHPDGWAEVSAADDVSRHEAQKLAMLGQLTGGVAHDFNNLLMPIVAGLDLLGRRHADGRSQRLIGNALAAADRAKLLVARLLAFTRREVVEPRPVDVSSLVASMRYLIERSIGPAIRLEVNVTGRLPPALVDPNELELALLNLCVNARDAMPDGGALALDLSDHHVDAGVVPGLRPGRYLRLAVSDTGIGMDETVLRRATEPLFTTKAAGHGTGLGLSGVQELAVRAGGALQLQSAPGQGTTALLWLPTTTVAVAAASTGDDAPTRETQRATLLVVDDDELVRMTLAEALRELGYYVVEASCAAQALAEVRKGLVPDLLIVDQLMPDMTGQQLAREFRARLPELPVLLVTGQPEASWEQSHDFAVLAKPFRHHELAAMLTRLMPAREP